MAAKKDTERTCQRCGAKFLIAAYRLRHVPATFCSRRCRSLASGAVCREEALTRQVVRHNAALGCSEIVLKPDVVALIDDADAGQAGGFKWTLVTNKSGGRYAITTIEGKRTFLHQFVIGETPEGLEIDHKNGNGLDNRRENLRLATHQQNLMNRQTCNAASGFKGVYPVPSGRWTARPGREGDRRTLGTFDTAEEAARAYDAWAWEAFGEFAYLNFPEEHHGKNS